MTLFSYEIFDAVARQGSFNKAAQQLHLTPSAISHAIAVMEEELGFALFNRGKSGVTMTSYGASLYPSIRAVLNSDEALQQSIARLNGLEKGKVKLGTFNSVCAYLLPDILKSFKAQYPQIEVEVYQGTYDDVKEWLRSGQVDIGFLSYNCAEEFELTEILRDPLVCVVPRDWPAPAGGKMTPELMYDQSFVVQGDATDADVRHFIKKYKIATQRRCHVIDDMSNIAMVEAGVGIAIMPQLSLKNCTANVCIYPIDPPEWRTIGIAVPRASAMAPAVEQMFRHIVAFCKELPGVSV
jgi:DNA-binding transcriptional LysR family regulator